MDARKAAADYIASLAASTPLPVGFRLSTTSLRFFPKERPGTKPLEMNLSLILADEPAESFAFLTTRNRVVGASVQLARKRAEGRHFRGFLVNNRVANVAVASGEKDAERILTHLGNATSIPVDELLSVSTGVIGWRLPVEEILESLPRLSEGLGDAAPVDVARAIMTTDSYPKCRSVDLAGGHITAFAKGAGMIEPNLATMLVFVLTDLDLDRAAAEAALKHAVETSFNRISVDSDQSTSDLVALVSSRRAGAVDPKEFASALRRLCEDLAEDIVRNGEGVGHVLRVAVRGTTSTKDATALGKAVINSPLVKTAVYGNDPNVGRILMALGDCAGNNDIRLDPQRLSVRVGTEEVFRDGAFCLSADREQRLASYLRSAAMEPGIKGFPQHDRCVEIDVEMGQGDAAATVVGCDLTDHYISENADYRS